MKKSRADEPFAPPALPATIRQSRWHAAIYALGNALLAIAGYSAIGIGQKLLGYAAVSFFGIGLVVFLVMLIKPGTLIIDEQGITQTVLFRTRLFRWQDVDNFRSWRMFLGRLVAFDHRRPAGARAGGGINSRFGADAALAPGWRMKSRALAQLCNAARRQFLPGSQAVKI